MKLSRVLLILGIGANVFTVFFAIALGHMPGSQGSGTLFVLFFFPVIWIMVFVGAIIAVILFKDKALPDSTGLRILGFFFCTPIPIIAFVWIYTDMKEPDPSTYIPQPYIEYHNGVAFRYLQLNNYEGADHVVSRYRADSLEYVSKGDDAFVRDSTWIYYNGISDTIKMEYYKNDSLIRTVKGNIKY